MSDYPAVLYVEDDPMSRTVMEIILSTQLGLTNVAIFEDSTDFANQLEHLPFQPDIVFLDIHMEPIDGFAILGILRSHPRYAHLPIVALTASVMNEEIAQLKEVSFNGVVPKPIDIDTFPEIFERLIAGQEVWHVHRTH